MRMKKWSEAIIVLEKALFIAEEITIDELEISLLCHLSMCNIKIEMYEESLQLSLEALSIDSESEKAKHC